MAARTNPSFFIVSFLFLVCFLFSSLVVCQARVRGYAGGLL
jgi:hypothetical protein